MAEMRYQPKHTEGFFLDLVCVSLPLNSPFLICFSHPVTQLMKSFILLEYSYPTIKISPSFSPDQKKSSTELEYMSVLAREAVFPFAHQPFPVLASLSTKKRPTCTQGPILMLVLQLSNDQGGSFSLVWQEILPTLPFLFLLSGALKSLAFCLLPVWWYHFLPPF